jgi:hypothetical protein
MRLIDADVLETAVLGACWYDNRDEDIAYDLVENAGLEWIPVTERLPEHGESVLTYIRHSHVVYGRDDGFRAYRVYEFDGHFIGMGNLCEVVAWIPLPEPPKEVAND